MTARCCRILGAAVLVVCGWVPVLSAQTYVLESSDLEVRLQTDPYTLEVVEQATSQVLVSENRTAFEFSGAAYPVVRAEDVSEDDSSLEASLVLDGTNEIAELRLELTSPEVLTVNLFMEGAEAISERFDDRGEHNYGLWEHAYGGGIDNRGVSEPFVGLDFQLRQVYAPSIRAPFYMTSRKYGVYAATEAMGSYRIGRSGSTGFTFQKPSLTYHVIYGPSYKDILDTYNQIAGPPYMPPAWAFSTIWWRNDHHEIPPQLQDEVDNSQELLLRDARMLQANRIPASTMWIDRPFTTGAWGWGDRQFDETFPDPDGMVRELQHQYGMNLLYWITNRWAGEMKQDGLERGYLFDAYTEHPAADLRREPVRGWITKYLNDLMEDAMLEPGTSGVKGYKIDRGGEGEMPDSLINKQVTLFNRLAHEQMTAEHGNDFLIFARNLHDKSRRYVAHWNGDTRDSFEALRTSIKNALRSGLMNFPMWGSDTGSYDENPSKELYLRWVGFSAYSTMMEFVMEGRDQWFYGKNRDREVIQAVREASQAHHDLLPYSRSGLHRATETGVPVMRAMLLEFPDDPVVADMWDQFMYGPGLLVAPVAREGVAQRDVFLPEGGWLDYTDKSTVYDGRTTVTVDAPVGEVPVFVREGAIIPRGDILRANNNWTANWEPSLRIEVFPGRDQISTYDYYTGEQTRRITTETAEDGIQVRFGDLGHDGTIEIFARNVTEVIRNGEEVSSSAYEYDADTHKLTVSFEGAAQVRLPGAEPVF